MLKFPFHKMTQLEQKLVIKTEKTTITLVTMRIQFSVPTTIELPGTYFFLGRSE